MSRPEQYKQSYLPKWAQQYVANLERERENAISALNEYVDNQTPSPFYIDEGESTGESQGPTIKRRYIQGHKITVEHKGIRLEVMLRPNEYGIDLGWDDLTRGLKHVAMVPQSFNRVQLISKENMR
jgi:hypothetical protein